jgi:RecA-family ATPase
MNALRWVCWIWHKDKSKKWTKKPARPDYKPASSTDSATWSDFQTCFEAYQRDRRFAGVGFMLGGGFVGVDLDCCLSAEGELTEAARTLVSGVASYTDVSPTGTGIKIFAKGAKPEAWKNSEEVEIYDGGRFFTVTGMTLPGYAEGLSTVSWEFLKTEPVSDQYRHAINSMRKIEVNPGEQDGSNRLVQYARQAVRCGLDTVEAVEAIRDMLDEKPAPRDWTDDEILQRVDQASRRLASETRSNRLTLEALLASNPERKPELIDGLLRRGEVMNVIAASKQGKSWMMYALALSVSTGLPWLGHDVKAGRVLVVDNELHIEELAFRLRRACEGLFLSPSELGDRLIFEPMRGQWPTINEVDQLLATHYTKEDISLIVLDAYYRLLPAGVSENDNAAVTAIFNQLDRIAARHNCSIALVHHASKGDQSGKAITDVGSGAGALTRATDTHVIIRPHEDDAYAVMEAVCRSHQQPEPKTLRFEFPLWRVEEAIRPEVKLPKTRADEKQEQRDREAVEAVLKVLKEEVEATKSVIRVRTGMSPDRVNKTLSSLERQGRVQITKEVKVRGNLTELWALLEPITEEIC